MASWRYSSEPVASSGSLPLKVTGSYFLMVGTLEPRKNYALALDTLERLWNEGFDIKLVIVGKLGWMMDDFMQRVESHQENQKRLFVYTKVSDDELSAFYRSARALLFLSKGEGFGLPLLEAAEADTPIVCSDLPIFHEIAGSHATYVSIDDAERLKSQLQAWLEGDITPAQSSAIQRLSWQESAEMLVGLIADRRWQYRL